MVRRLHKACPQNSKVMDIKQLGFLFFFFSLSFLSSIYVYWHVLFIPTSMCHYTFITFLHIGIHNTGISHQPYLTSLQLERSKKQWFRPSPTTYIYANTVKTPKFSSTCTWPDTSRDCVGSHGQGLRKFGWVSNNGMLFPALNHSEQFG